MTALNKQALREAAEKATPGRVGDRIDGSGSIKYECHGYDGSLVLRTDHKNMEYGFIGDNGNADELFFRLCVPDVVLALLDELDELEAAQSYAKERDEENQDLMLTVGRLRVEKEAAEKRIAEHNFENRLLANADRDIKALRQRIAELEAGTVAVKPFGDFQIVHYGGSEDYAKGYIDCQNNYNKALAAAGIGVKG
ncbi:ead/Ea22-like family protein [Citrobacter freundii]|nr:ead/Ea22-like family protein [Citrobacter freundii]